MAALRELNVRQNQLTSLPEALGKLKNLEGLFLSENQLEALPDLSGCSAARAQRQTWPRRSAPIGAGAARGGGRCRECEGRAPDTFACGSRPRPHAGTSLAGVNANQNKLKGLPDGLCKCAKMEGLFGDENQIAELPEDFGAMSGLEEVRARACPRARARPRPRLRPHCHSRRRRRPRRRPRRRLSSSTLRVRARAPCAPGAAAPLPRASAGRCRSTRTTSTSCPRASAGPPVGKAAVRPGRREPDTHRRAGVARVGLWRSQYLLHARGVSTAGVRGTPAPNGCLARRKAPAILFEGHRRLCRKAPGGRLRTPERRLSRFEARRALGSSPAAAAKVRSCPPFTAARPALEAADAAARPQPARDAARLNRQPAQPQGPLLGLQSAVETTGGGARRGRAGARRRAGGWGQGGVERGRPARGALAGTRPGAGPTFALSGAAQIGNLKLLEDFNLEDNKLTKLPKVRPAGLPPPPVSETPPRAARRARRTVERPLAPAAPAAPAVDAEGRAREP